MKRVAAAFGIVLAVAWTAAAQEPLGPAPRDDAGRFLNEAGDLGQAGLPIALPFFLRRIGWTLRGRPGAHGRVENDGETVRALGARDRPHVTWIGHATLLVQMEGVNLLTDPIWSRTASPVSWAGPRRYVEPGIALEDLPRIDLVLISHNHYDHLDLPSLRALAERSPDTLFVVPLGNAELLRGEGVANVRELDWGQELDVGNVRVVCLPAQHWSRRGLRDMREALWASWAVIGAERRFWFAGDSGYTETFRRIGEAHGPFDLAAIPVGAYLPEAMMRPYHVNPEEAIQVALDVRARRALAIHFGTFDLADEPLDEPPRRFLEAGHRSALAPENVWVMAIGETRPF